MNNKIIEGFYLVKQINPETRLFLVNKYVNGELLEQPKGKSLYWAINGHTNGARKKKTLEHLYCFGIDIDSRKNGIPDEVVFEKLKNLKENYNLSPNLINDTSGGFHIIFNIEKTLYKLYKKELPIIYKFLNEKLGGDVKFKFITGILKLPGSVDGKNGKEIIPIKMDFSYKYKFDDFIHIINKEYGYSFKIKDNVAELEVQKIKKENKNETKNTFLEKIESLGALTDLNLKSDDLDKKSQIGVIDNLRTEGIEIEFDEYLFINGHRIQVNKETNTIYDCVGKGRGGVVGFLMNYVLKELRYSEKPYLEMLKFLTKYYGIKKVSDSYLHLNSYVYKNFIDGIYEIDEEKIKKDYGEIPSDLVQNIKEEILDNNGKLKGYGLLFLVNILSIAEKRQYTFTKVTLNTIFKNSYLSKENIRGLKKKLLIIINYLEYIKVKVQYVEYFYLDENDLTQGKRVLTTYLNPISFLKLEEVKNRTYMTITLFNGLKGIIHILRSRTTYIPKNVLKVQYHKLRLFAFLNSNIETIKKKGLNLSITQINCLLGRNTEFEKNQNIIKHRLKNILVDILYLLDKDIVISLDEKSSNYFRIINR